MTNFDELRGAFPILDFFKFSHLPENLQQISSPFAILARSIAGLDSKHPAEKAAALRKLLEAKDCAVRAAL